MVDNHQNESQNHVYKAILNKILISKHLNLRKSRIFDHKINIFEPFFLKNKNEFLQTPIFENNFHFTPKMGKYTKIAEK